MARKENIIANHTVIAKFLSNWANFLLFFYIFCRFRMNWILNFFSTVQYIFFLQLIFQKHFLCQPFIVKNTNVCMHRCYAYDKCFLICHFLLFSLPNYFAWVLLCILDMFLSFSSGIFLDDHIFIEVLYLIITIIS